MNNCDLEKPIKRIFGITFVDPNECPICHDLGEIRWSEIRPDGTLGIGGNFCDCAAGKALYNELTSNDAGDPDIYP